MSNFKERLEQEKLSLSEKINKLDLFLKKLDSPEPKVDISSNQLELLKKQIVSMKSYRAILHLRIKDLIMTSKEPEEKYNPIETEETSFGGMPIPKEIGVFQLEDFEPEPQDDKQSPE